MTHVRATLWMLAFLAALTGIALVAEWRFTQQDAQETTR